MARWGERVGRPHAGAKSSTGIYVVALTDAVDRVNRTLAEAPILPMALTTLLRRRPELTLDGSRPTARQLAARLGEFWLLDETILYMKTTGPFNASIYALTAVGNWALWQPAGLSTGPRSRAKTGERAVGSEPRLRRYLQAGHVGPCLGQLVRMRVVKDHRVGSASAGRSA